MSTAPAPARPTPAPLAELEGAKNATASTAGYYEHMNVVSTNMHIYNFWNESPKFGAPAGTASAPLAGVAWEHKTYTYNTSYPGRLEIQLCSDVPRRCYDVSNHPEAWFTAYNDLDAATTKFLFRYRWYNASRPDNGRIYDPWVGAGAKPFVTASAAAWWD
ncbi:hypothetical protein BJY21_004201 [Kineosphaera limosa]|uniref:hypothetical protein n=1 Tax=Kineosphaera limosa TaxID=111564 RepID=UPI0002EE9B7F|nr:hypothetical protein [Kineosphaera limosa]NYE03017.1 hypothetical protein [Kineosphaera limosa]